MKNKKEPPPYSESRRVRPWLYTVALLVNVLVFIVIIMVYRSSDQSYTQKLFAENIHNVENLNAASANAAHTYTSDMGVKIDDAAGYIRAENMRYAEAAAYLGAANTSPDRQFQLVRSGRYGETGQLSFGDYTGLSIRKTREADGTYRTIEQPIQYGSGYYDIYRTFTDINDENDGGRCFAPEFTDPDTKLKCFAVYRHIALTDDAGQKTLYTLLLAINSQTALSKYDAQKEYEGQSSVLVNAAGDYIIKNSDYRNVNFYDYIVNYNDLTLDWREKIRAQVTEGTAEVGASVNLFYRNHQGADCVFSAASMENGWYSITCVPLSSFSLEGDTVDYSLIILLIFLLLFVLDGLAVYYIGKTMSYNVAVAEKATAAATSANQAKSRFLSTMSHELRTPLNAIMGLVALSSDSLEDPSLLRDYLRKIDISSKLLLQLISDILDVSAIESNKMKLCNDEFDMTKLITSLSAIYYDQCAAKGIEFSVALRNVHSEKLVGDAVRVNQVLLNLLSNAVKFTPGGGKVTLSAEQVEKQGDRVVIRFVVSDTGCGVSEELRARLFQPFERASGAAARKYGGTGLGLSIVKNLVGLMGGQVGLESVEGAGSSFWAEIPFTVPEQTARGSISPIENMRVLAAISDEDERAYIGQILTGFGVERTLTDRADAALALLREGLDGGAPYTLCILDWKMPDLSGPDAAARVRAELGDRTPHIMVLTYNLAKASAQCTEAGADLVFGKPVFPSALYNTLEEIASDQVRALPTPERGYDLSGKRILLVEDNALNTEIARLLLNKVGAEVETAENGEVGLQRFLASAPGHFDAILMDVQMPVLDGYQATAAIRASAHPQARSIPILAMTADAFTEDVKKASAAGMNEHIAKPVVPDNLYAVLKKYLR